jgi:hypothetical protein
MAAISGRWAASMRLAIALACGSVRTLATTATICRACAWWLIISCMNRVSSGSTAGLDVAGMPFSETLGSPGLPGWSTGALGAGTLPGCGSLAESFDYCDATFETLNDQKILSSPQMVTSFLHTTVHNNEIYGNVVGYLRANHILPPSTEMMQEMRKGKTAAEVMKEMLEKYRK